MTKSSGLGRSLFEKHARLRPEVQLQPHQLDLVEKSRRVPGGQIANWTTGAGKSPGSVAVAEDRGGTALVIVPAALRSNYREAIEKFTTPDRHKAYTVMSFEQYSRDPHDIIDKLKPNTVVVDEFHRARNAGQARAALEATRHKMPYVLANTASLINNRPEELVPLVNLAAGHQVYPSEAEFSRRHLVTEKVPAPGLSRLWRAAGEREKLVNEKELKKRISPYVHRFKPSAEFKSNFPDVVEEVKHVDLSDKQRELMRAIMRQNPGLAHKIKANLPPNKQDLKNMNSFSVALRQIANNPAEFDTSIKDKIEASPKFKAMLEEQRRMAAKDPNFRSVVYSNFLSSGVLPVIERTQASGASAEAFVGGMSDAKRRAMVARYNAGRTRTLGISPAGAEGLDLKGTKLLQLTEDHWNPERKYQAMGRGARFKSHAHLPEKERKLVVQRFIAKYPKRWWHKVPGLRADTSIDEWIDARRNEKEQLNQQFLAAI